jgi:hypothetical protein
MNIRARGGASFLLTTALAAAGIATAGCGGSTGAPPLNAPPASRPASAERAATMHWLAATNHMWTRGDFAALDQVTTGEARAVYQAEQRQSADTIALGRTPFQLTGLSITVPCSGGTGAGGGAPVFVAYGDTDVFTLGQSMRPQALVFQHAGGTWKLAAVVNGSSGTSQPRWPALCRAGADPAAAAVLPPADYRATLARVLDHASTGATETAQAAAPFAVNSFFTGPDSINTQFATDSRHDRADGVTLVQRFAPAAGPALALPLAGGRGYWLIGVFAQTSTYHSATGTRKASWPDGSSIASPRPAVVHQETDTFVTTYSATDPLRSSGGRVVLDGFFGWPLTDSAR